MRNWREYAACREIPTEMFFCEGDAGNSWVGPEYQMLLKVCRNECPVQRQCLASALRMEQHAFGKRHGIWGGMTPPERDRFWGKLQTRRDNYVVEQCSNGHDLTEDNVTAMPRGALACIQCQRDKNYRGYLKRQAQKKAQKEAQKQAQVG